MTLLGRWRIIINSDEYDQLNFPRNSTREGLARITSLANKRRIGNTHGQLPFFAFGSTTATGSSEKTHKKILENFILARQKVYCKGFLDPCTRGKVHQIIQHCKSVLQWFATKVSIQGNIQPYRSFVSVINFIL